MRNRLRPFAIAVVIACGADQRASLKATEFQGAAPAQTTNASSVRLSRDATIKELVESLQKVCQGCVDPAQVRGQCPTCSEILGNSPTFDLGIRTGRGSIGYPGLAAYPGLATSCTLPPALVEEDAKARSAIIKGLSASTLRAFEAAEPKDCSARLLAFHVKVLVAGYQAHAE